VDKGDEMAVGIYPRVSTAGQVDNTSLNEQIRLCKEKAKQLGYYESNIKVYSEGSSGEDIDTRVELTKLREDVASGLISAVICTHPDRFSRDLTDKLIVCREFQKNGAKLYFTDTQFEDSPEGVLFFNVMSAIASYELQLIRKRTIRGRIAKVKNEKKIMPMRVAPFGYDKDEEGQLIINEAERQYVQMIYEWYVLEKLTLREIGGRLYGKVKPKRGESSNWGASSISKILTSEIYIGKYYYNRRETKKVRGELTAGGKPKKTYTFRDSKDWLTVDVPPLVDIEMWKLAQMQRVQNDTNKHVGNKKYQYLLKSLLKCGHCGRTFDATTVKGAKDKETGEIGKSRRYRCPNTVPKKYGPEIEKCIVPSFNAEQIEDYIWGQVIRIVTDPVKFVTQIKGKGEESIVGVKERLTQLEKDLKMKENALENVERRLFEAENDDEIKRFEKHRQNYINEIAGLEEEIENYQAKIDAHRLEELSVEQITFMVNKIRTLLSSDEEVPFDTKRNIVEMLFDEIIITVNKGGDGGGGSGTGLSNGTEINITSVGLFDSLYQENKNDGLCSQPQKIRQYRRRPRRFNFDRDDWLDQSD
jgi:site-specific DNA recombinase